MKRHLKVVFVTTVCLVAWAIVAVVGAFSGWWLTPLAQPGDRDGFFRAIVELVNETTNGNAAVLAIEQGEVGFEFYTAGDEVIDRDTLFPTASFSKFVTAVAVMALVEQGRIDLDAPVSRYLTRWALPTAPFSDESVTVARLLSHTAGLTDDLGFGDYGADETLPPLEMELASPRASSGKTTRIAVGVEPGSAFKYSGGGYLVLELVVEEVSGQPFAEFVTDQVLAPLGMDRSNYAFPGSLNNVARNRDRNGNVVPWVQYASRAATALNSSTADLARLALSLLPAAEHPVILEQATVALMREPRASTSGIDIWGLGTILYAPAGESDFVFGHDGANDPAINSSLRINPVTGDAIIALSNGHPSLATTIGFHWVLWQTGYPDPLNVDAVLQSLWLPLGAGSLFILLAAVLMLRATRPRQPVPG